ncbi:MAG: hypothetical protein ACR2QB_08510 [Gammaproteobacteria bacterium]
MSHCSRRPLVLCIALLGLVAASPTMADDKARKAQQRNLDNLCEAARVSEIDRVRDELVAECVAAEEGTQPDCMRMHRNHGARSGNRAALYYDLPACEEATAFRRSTRAAK